MNHAFRTTVLACAGALLIGLGAISVANAEYSGYGNGDPGNWDFATEQSGGPCGKGTAARDRPDDRPAQVLRSVQSGERLPAAAHRIAVWPSRAPALAQVLWRRH